MWKGIIIGLAVLAIAELSDYRLKRMAIGVAVVAVCAIALYAILS
jgi:hypothetical protein